MVGLDTARTERIPRSGDCAGTNYVVPTAEQLAALDREERALKRLYEAGGRAFLDFARLPIHRSES